MFSKVLTYYMNLKTQEHSKDITKGLRVYIITLVDS